MKRLFILLCLLIISVSSFGQAIKLGVLAGPNESTFYPGQPDVTPSSAITGFHISVFTEIVKGDLSIEPGLVYASIGGINIYDDYPPNGVNGGIYDYHVQYLQIPVNFAYNMPVAGGKFFIGGGPYVGVGISGTTHQTGENYQNSKITANINTVYSYGFSEADDPDFGLNAIAGLHLKNKILLTMGYGFGLKRIFKVRGNYLEPYYGTYGNYNIPGLKNNVFSLSIGYAFL